MATQNNNTRQELVVTREGLVVDSVYQHQYKKDRDVAQLRQVTYREYPGSRADNSLQDSLFSQEKYGFGPSLKAQSTRMAWIDLPKGTTEEQVRTMLDNYANAGIKQILSDQPIVTAEQAAAIANGTTTLNVIAYGTDGTGGQLVRYPANAKDRNGNAVQEGTFIPGPTGKEQFKVTVFKLDVTSTDGKDEDLREQASGVTSTSSITLAGMLEEQSGSSTPAGADGRFPLKEAPVAQAAVRSF